MWIGGPSLGETLDWTLDRHTVKHTFRVRRPGVTARGRRVADPCWWFSRPTWFSRPNAATNGHLYSHRLHGCPEVGCRRPHRQPRRPSPAQRFWALPATKTVNRRGADGFLALFIKLSVVFAKTVSNTVDCGGWGGFTNRFASCRPWFSLRETAPSALAVVVRPPPAALAAHTDLAGRRRHRAGPTHPARPVTSRDSPPAASLGHVARRQRLAAPTANSLWPSSVDDGGHHPAVGAAIGVLAGDDFHGDGELDVGVQLDRDLVGAE